MSEKKSYSVDDIINETRQLHNKHSEDDQKKIALATEEILKSLGTTANNSAPQKTDDNTLDDWMDNFNSRIEEKMSDDEFEPVGKPKEEVISKIKRAPTVEHNATTQKSKSSAPRKSIAEQKMEKSIVDDELTEFFREALKKPVTSSSNVIPKKEPVSQPKADVSKKAVRHRRSGIKATQEAVFSSEDKQEKIVSSSNPLPHRSIDETVNLISKAGKSSTIDDIVNDALQDESRKVEKSEKRLSRTGVIRKADSLISEDADGIITHLPAASPMDMLSKSEKVVGEKEDAREKLYNEYIRTKELKKQDTGIIKTIGIKLAGSEPKTVLPTIDRETNMEKTIVRNTNKKVLANFDHTGNIEGQTRLEGFESDNVEKISEDELESQLDKNRKKKICEFKFEEDYKAKHIQPVETASHSSVDDTYSPKKETPVINEIVDYNSKNDRRAVFLELQNMRVKFRIRSFVSIFIEIIIAVVGLLGSGIMSNFGLGTGGEKIYIIINLALLLLMSIVSAKAIFKGIVALSTLKPSGDSLMAFAVIVTFVQSILALALGGVSAGASHIYVAAAGFMLLLNSLGKSSMTRRIQKNFRTIINNNNKYSVACITDEKEADEMAKGAELPYYDIRYNVKTEFATKFLANSYASDPADDMARRTAYFAIGASVVLAVISYFISKDILSAVAVLTTAVLMSVPAADIISFNLALENANKELANERGAICGFDAVEDASKTNAIILGSEELFPERATVLKGMKLFSHMKIDDALVYTASVLRETNHPFKKVFMESVEAVNEHLPKASDTTYEARLGIASWIYNRKILLGNEEMMGAHGISIPLNAHPEEYMQGNTRVMFLSVDSVISAMFVLEYNPDQTVEYELQRLEASCVEILVRTDDSNIDEDFLSYLFRLSDNSVRVMNLIAGQMYNEKCNKPVMNEAKIVNRGDPVTFMRSITACSMLGSQFKLLKIIQYVSMAIGFAVIAVFGLLNSISTISALHIIIYSAIWATAVIAIPKIYKAVPPR